MMYTTNMWKPINNSSFYTRTDNTIEAQPNIEQLKN